MVSNLVIADLSMGFSNLWPCENLKNRNKNQSSSNRTPRCHIGYFLFVASLEATVSVYFPSTMCPVILGYMVPLEKNDP